MNRSRDNRSGQTATAGFINPDKDDAGCKRPLRPLIRQHHIYSLDIKKKRADPKRSDSIFTNVLLNENGLPAGLATLTTLATAHAATTATTAAAAAATAAAVTATATAAAATAATATLFARLRLGFVHAKCATIHILAIQCVDCSLRLSAIGHFDKTKTLGTTGHPISNNASGGYFTIRSKCSLQGVITRRIGKIAHIDIHFLSFCT
jgi:hypothetical protein